MRGGRRWFLLPSSFFAPYIAHAALSCPCKYCLLHNIGWTLHVLGTRLLQFRCEKTTRDNQGAPSHGLKKMEGQLEDVLPHVVPWLRVADVVRAASCSQGCRRAIQDKSDGFWDLVDFSANGFPLGCVGPLEAFLASRLTRHGSLIRGLSVAFSPDFSDLHTPLLPPGLCHLDFNGCKGITDTGLLEVARRCHRLERFQVYWNVRATCRGVIPVIEANAKTLTTVNLSGSRSVVHASRGCQAANCCRMKR